MRQASKNSKYTNDNESKNTNIFYLRLMLYIVLLTSIPFMFYNPDLSFGFLDIFRQDFFKTEIVLSGYKNNTEGLIKAIQDNNAKIVKLFVRSGFNLNSLTFSGISPLCSAAENGNQEIVDILMRGNINLLIKNPSNGLTPLYCAIKGNNINIIDKFAENGVSLTTRNQWADGISPLHYAAALGRDTIVSYLISKGADVNLADSSGQTPLHMAVLQDNITVLYILINAGAYVDIVDKSGLTPLDIVIQKENKNYISLLERYTKIKEKP
ncbi:ankyrin repeat domain-containing protein [bacterium]|nr:ankyrin repeat domain-containing protein [bacterium]